MSTTAIIIPCYNEGKRLKKTINFVYYTKNNNYHLLFIDDGSNDNTFKTLTELKSRN